MGKVERIEVWPRKFEIHARKQALYSFENRRIGERKRTKRVAGEKLASFDLEIKEEGIKRRDDWESPRESIHFTRCGTRKCGGVGGVRETAISKHWLKRNVRAHRRNEWRLESALYTICTRTSEKLRRDTPVTVQYSRWRKIGRGGTMRVRIKTWFPE